MEKEHILPLSLSADNSYVNLTASCRACNARKENKTPYQFMQQVDYELFQKRILNNNKLTEKKQQNLLFTGDLNKYAKKFINRNLRDTAYATNEFLNQLNIFKLAREQQTAEIKFKSLSMAPKITSLVRRNQLSKDRKNHYHHAVDAVIVASYITKKTGMLAADIANDPASF